MFVPAAPGDTWGISGPTFLAAFAAAAVILVAIALVNRHAALRFPHQAATRLPTAGEIALLQGGPTRALHASLGALRAAGAIELEPGQRLTVTGPAPIRLARLDQAVYDAAHRRVTMSELPGDMRVASALAELHADAERSGWLLDASQRRLARLGGVALIGIAVIGFVRTAAGIASDKPVLGIAALSIATLAVGVILCRVPRHTPAWRTAVAEVRNRNRHLDPSRHPAWSTYGQTGAAMGVALFGASALWAADPAFAQRAGLAHMRAHTAASSSAGGSCGGGGTSCGDGASCGGGGGCGGGCGG